MLWDARIVEIIQRTHNVKSLRFLRTKELSFQAGQFMRVTLDVDGAEQSKYFSFSSAPTEHDHIEFTKKMSNSPFSKALERLTIGDTIKIKMPFGKFILDEKESRHAFLSGGIGITPIRSMLRDALDRRLSCDMVLFYGNRSPEDIVFRPELEEMTKEHKNLKIVFSLDTTEACPDGWKGRCGFINADSIKEELPDYAERIFYVCGPPVMVQSLTSILEDQLKVSTERIQRENFSGY